MAYRYSYVCLDADGEMLVVQPIDCVGESPLLPGKHTYVLSFEYGRLNIRAEED